MKALRVRGKRNENPLCFHKPDPSDSSKPACGASGGSFRLVDSSNYPETHYAWCDRCPSHEQEVVAP